MFPALLLRWEADLGWSKVDLTGALALAVLASGVASPFSGRLIDRGWGPQLMACSAALGGCGLLVLSQVTTLSAFYTCWLVIGLSLSGCLYEPCFALVTRARGSEAKRSIVVITLFAGFAGTLSFPLTHLISDAHGWRTTAAVFAVGVITVVAPMLWAGARRVEAGGHALRTAAPPETATDRPFLQRPAFWLLAAGFSLLAVVHGATLHHLLPILAESGWSADAAVFAAACIGPSQVAGRLAMVAVGHRVSNHALTVTACLAIGLSVVLLQLSTGAPVLLGLAILAFGGAYGTVSILRPVVARDILGGAQFGAKSGALALPYLVGSALAPFLGALVWRVGGYATLLPCLAGLAAVGCALYMRAHRSPR
ncbi:MAG: MFS transporter [Pseudomonadota bacterium]